ncbi:MAG: hypothetical protein JWP57_482 [Spirosoma sp.]|nr:hypothetical protein [Spirosoma sp.]
MPHFIGYLLLFLLPFSTVAQDSLLVPGQPKWFIKWNPLSLLDTESMFQISAEHRITKRTAIQAELGYGPPFLSSISPLNNGSLDHRQAWRLRMEYRLYRLRDSQKGRYWALEAFAMTVNGTRVIFIDTLLFPIHKRVLGGHVKAGIQRPFGRQTRFYYDFYAGLGLRYNHTFADPANGLPYIHPVGGWFDLYRPRNYLAPSVTIGLKLAYPLNGSA